MRIKVKNNTKEIKKIIVVVREEIELEPGEEVDVDGDVELESWGNLHLTFSGNKCYNEADSGLYWWKGAATAVKR